MPNIQAHKFLRYSTDLPDVHEVRKIAQYVLNHYQSPVRATNIRDYKNMRVMNLTWTDSKGNTHTGQVSFNKLVEHIQTTLSLDVELFNLPRLECTWLDCAGLSLQRNFHILADHTEPVKLQLQTPFGEKFPFRPGLDREGMAYASFQIPIQKNLVYLHKQVVQESQHSVTTDHQWLNNLRMLINECVSIVDITLHQIYAAAEYRINPQWTFSPDRLKKQRGMRITDKFEWIGQITGRPLDNAKANIDSFNLLRGIRNHLNHFEPPCFALTPEDVMEWLNKVPRIGYLLWKIREKLEAQLTPELIQIVLLPQVIFDSERRQSLQSNKRIPQPTDSGYNSCRRSD